jgi:hypothetical protein
MGSKMKAKLNRLCSMACIYEEPDNDYLMTSGYKLLDDMLRRRFITFVCASGDAIRGICVSGFWGTFVPMELLAL